MARPWVVTPGSLAGFLKRADLALIVVAARPRFSPAVARHFTGEHGRDVSLGTVASAPWFLPPVASLFEDVAALDAPPDGYYLFRAAAAVAHHPGALERERAPRSVRGVIAAAADVAAKAVDPLDGVSARAVIDAFTAALVTRPPPRRAAEDSPYAVLKVPPSATDAEVKAAHKQALLENHPDRVAQMGPEIRALAAKNTQRINEAYQAIRKLRRGA